MPQVNFLNEFYKAYSADQNSSSLINMYLEEDKNNGKYPVIALPTPGTSVFSSSVSGTVTRASIVHLNIYYAVIDNKLYSFNSSGTPTTIGTISTSSGPIELAAITNEIMLVDCTNGNGYIYNTNTLVFSQIIDADYPTNVRTVTAIDEFFMVGLSNSVYFYGSDAGTGTTWNALSFSSSNTDGDTVNRVISYRQQLWVFGNYQTLVYYNSGAATFSFDRIQGSLSHYGCAAYKSVAIGANNIYLLAQNASGGLAVISFSDNYQPNIVSSRAIMYQINQLTTISDAFGYCYQENGHEHYVLTFPTEARTFVYDLTTDLWHERQSTISGSQTRHISNCYSYCYGKHLIGAYNSGTIFRLNSQTFTENGTTIYREIITSPAYGDGKKIYTDNLQIDVESGIGSNPTLTLNISYDSGRTYTNTLTNTIPNSGGRMYWRRLGYTQNAFVFKLSASTDYKLVVLGAIADIRLGIN